MLSVFTKRDFSIEERHHGPSDALHNPSQPFKFLSKDTCLICHGDTHDFYRLSHSELVDIDFLTPITKNQNALIDSQVVNKSPTHYPCDSARTFRVILFSIRSDEWKSFQCQHQTALRYKQRCCSLIPAELDSLPHAHAQTTKTFYKHQYLRIKKAQELKTKTSAPLIFKIFPKRYQDYQDKDCQGILLTSFQDDSKYEHVEFDLLRAHYLRTFGDYQNSKYVPDPMELEDHVPVYILEPEHPEDLVPAEDEAPTPLLL
ncbi:hypothetical protein Tco_1243063 [Tanacetum coccineum]